MPTIFTWTAKVPSADGGEPMLVEQRAAVNDAVRVTSPFVCVGEFQSLTEENVEVLVKHGEQLKSRYFAMEHVTVSDPMRRAPSEPIPLAGRKSADAGGVDVATYFAGGVGM